MYHDFNVCQVFFLFILKGGLNVGLFIVLAVLMIAWLAIQAKVGYTETVERHGGDELWLPAVIAIVVIVFFTALIAL